MITGRSLRNAATRLAVALAASLFVCASAQAVYVNRYSTTTNGAITFTGNTLGLDGSGTSGTPGANGSIGAFTSTNTALQFGTYPPGTTNAWASNSSNATLTIPAGSTILYAELIWGGGYSYGTQDVTAFLGNSISFKTPSGTFSVAPQTAQNQGSGSGGTCTTGPCRYVRSANVTGLIQIGGAGTYEVGGVPATVGNGDANNHTAGWTLAVVYGNTSMPPRNLNLFVGAEIGGNPATGVSGFCTNLAGPVKGRLLVSAMEGDAAIPGDQMKFGPTTASMVSLSGPNNPVGNFFDGQLNNDAGSLDSSGTFGSSNHNASAGLGVSGARQGYDITNVDVSPALVNGQTAAVAQGTTTGDQYTINALGMQIDVGAPKFPTVVKTANRTVTMVGDIVTYTVSLNNTAGTANATNVRFTDALPPGMSFRSGTVLVNGVAQAAFDPVAGFTMGTINVGTIATVQFQANVDAIPAAPAAAQFVNKAKWTYDFISCAGFSTESGSVETNIHILPAVRLAPTKTVSPTGPVGIGTTLTYTITVPNTGATASSGTTLADPIPTGTSYVANSTTLNGIAVADVAGAMPFAAATTINSPSGAAGAIVAGEAATMVFRVTVNAGAPAAILNTASIDPDGAGPGVVQSAQATNTPLTPPVVSKLFAPSTISIGQAATLTITVTNGNATTLNLAAVSDTLPAGLIIANPANTSTSCGSGTAVAAPGGITLGLSGGTIPASGSCTISAAVTGTSAGTFTNTIPIGAVTTANAGGNTAAANASITVALGPSVNKAFSPAAIAPGGISSLTLTLVNPTATALSAAAISDALPAGITVAVTPNATNNCGGSFAPVAGAASVSLSGATIPAANTCSIKVDVTASTVGNYNNVLAAGALTSSGGSNGSAAQADLNVASPLIGKGFTPSTVGANVNSSLTITLKNVTSVTVTGASFSDVFPSSPGAMTLGNTSSSNSCGGTLTDQSGAALAVGSTGIKLVGGTIPVGGTCSISVNVRAPVGGTYVNTIPIGALTTTNGGASTVAASGSLAVGLPSAVKAFGTIAAPVATFAAGATVALAIQVTNPNAAALTLTTLTDLFPSGMTLANTTVSNGCGGSVTNQSGAALAVGASGIRLSGGSIAANSSCTLSINVTAAAAGDYTNTISAGQVVTPSGNNAFDVSATVTALARPTISKSFTAASISPTGTSLLTITLANSNAQTLVGAAFTDLFPTSPGAMTLANGTTTNTCGGSLADSGGGAIAAGDVGLRLSAGSMPGNGSCSITATVTASVAGAYSNTIAAGGLTTTNGGSNTAAATGALTVAIQAPAIGKAFSPNPVAPNTPTRLTFTIVNPNTATALNAVQFSDTLPTTPAPMVVAATPTPSTAGCGSPSFAPTAGAASVTMTGATIAAGATCIVAVNVVAPATGSYANVSGAVSSSNGGSGGSASSTLRVLQPPLVTKAFSVNPVNTGAASVLTITVSNPNASDALTGVAVFDTYPAGLTNTASPNANVSCSAGSSATATGGAASGNSVGLSAASLTAGGLCSITVNVSASAAGNIDNVTGLVTSSNAGSGTSASSRLVVGATVSGFVYADANSNSSKDGSEAGTGVTLYAKLIAAGVVQQMVAVNTVSGAYSFTAVAGGSYTVIIDDNNNPADLTATIPAPWAGTEVPTQSRAITVAAVPLSNQNFGLANGTRISGRVFRDTGSGGAIANDGLQTGTEPGIASVTVTLTNCAASTLASTSTDGSGNYNLIVPLAVANGATVCVLETNPAGFLSTGGAPGSTAGAAAGTYSRTSDTISFTFNRGVSHSGLNFADVPVNTFSTDGAQAAAPGTSITYPHTFVAASAGSLSFSSSAVATPTIAGWSEVRYRDSNCNGVLDAAEPVIGAPIAVLAGDQVCIIVKEFVPAGAAVGAQNQVTISASFSYSNALPSLSATYSHTDLTTVGTASSAGLNLVKSVDKATALPGDTIIYTITYRNDSSGTISSVTINDATPAFTTFLAAGCGANPPNITACAVTSQPIVSATGAIIWSLTGGLLPGASSTVSFSVRVVP